MRFIFSKPDWVAFMSAVAFVVDWITDSGKINFGYESTDRCSLAAQERKTQLA